MSFFCFVFSPTSLFIDVTSYQVKSIYRFKSIGRPWISQATQRRLRFNKLHALSLPFLKNKFNTIIFFSFYPFFVLVPVGERQKGWEIFRRVGHAPEIHTLNELRRSNRVCTYYTVLPVWEHHQVSVV